MRHMVESAAARGSLLRMGYQILTGTIVLALGAFVFFH